MLKVKTSLVLLALCGSAYAATAPAAAPAAAAAASTTVTPAKKELVQKILQLWNIDSIGQSMLAIPVGDAVQQARAMLQGRAVPERRDAAMTDIMGEARKFMDEAVPITKASADKLIQADIAPLLTERFSEDELRQLVAILESPVKKKFEDMLPDIKKTLGEGVAADTHTAIDPKLQSLKERIGLRLRTAVTP